jgi:uncharacterized protein (DUF885 family)
VTKGPPIWLEDKHGYPLPEGDSHVSAIWYMSSGSEIPAKLENCLEGEERDKLWNSQKEVLSQMEAAEASDKAAEASDKATKVRALLDEDFAFICEDNPEYASQAGKYAHDDKLQDLSPAAFDERCRHNQAMLGKVALLADELKKTGGDEAGNKKALLHLELFRKSVADELEALSLRCHLYPVNSIGYGGVHYNFIEALDWLGQTDAKDTNLLSRVEAFAGQAESYKALLRQGMAEQRLASKSMVRKVPEQLRALLADLDVESSPVDKLLMALPAHLSARAASSKASFRASVEALLHFFEKSYMPQARSQEGCAGLPDGAQVYALCLRYHTTTTMTPEEVHDVGQREVARIKQRYQHDVLDKLGFTSSFDDFVTHCRAPESGQYFATKEELLDAYRALVTQIRARLPAYFERQPRAALEVVDKNAESAPAAYYMQGTADGKRPGKFYVNVSNLHQRPKYEMVALALHEGIPGHHLQGSLALEDDNLPPFLRFIEDRRYEFCPARRQLYAAYLEGWALYCEALGEEMGLYSDPLSLFGRLSMEMMRAVRLVVDTGIHSKGWSVEQAIVYMMDKTGMHRHECEAECYRYEAWPGQACAYKVGEIAMWRMRRAAETTLADKFDLKAFLNVLLCSGPLPLDTLAMQVDEWVAQTKASSDILVAST